MHKLKLRLEDLRIDSFTTMPAEKEKGTVFGEVEKYPRTYYTCIDTCGANDFYGTCAGTCDLSCGGTCENTCENTCGPDTCDYTCENSCGPDTCDFTVCGC